MSKVNQKINDILTSLAKQQRQLFRCAEDTVIGKGM